MYLMFFLFPPAVKLPSMSPTMERGALQSWSKAEGDELGEGDVLAQVETDKATMDMETPEEGFLAKILVPAGTKEIPIGQVRLVSETSSNSLSRITWLSVQRSPSNKDTLFAKKM